jgi:hypothetical protein
MVPLDVLWRSRFTIGVVIAALSACGGTPREASRPNVTKAPVPDAERGHLDDPDLNRAPPKKLLSIDWATTTLASDADALALWQRIAPTGADYSEKLDELPDGGTIVEQLAVALLREGNFTCTHPAPPLACARKPLDVPEPAPDATLADPCLRRVLAIWAISQLEDDQLAPVRDALRAIVAIPPPESELTAAALKALPETDHAGRLELLALAFRAGHRELVNGHLGTLDEPHLLEAVQKHHIDGALDLLTATSHRAVFLGAITNEQLHARARVQAIVELANADEKLAPDTRAAVVRARQATSCHVAAAATLVLVRNGEKKLGPGKPRTAKPAAMMRALCVLASYEAAQRADEPSFLLGYVPKKGLELVTTTYDEYNEVDTDGDGDPHTERKTVIVPRDEVTLPELEDLMRAFTQCTGTTCRSEDREFRFVFKGADLLLTRLEVTERPPCGKRGIPNP